MRLIEFVDAYGRTVWINPEYVAAVYSADNDLTTIVLSTGITTPSSLFVVRGTPQRTIALLEDERWNHSD